MGPQGWRVNVGRGVAVGQFEFPFLAGRGMAGLGDGNRGTDIRAASRGELATAAEGSDGKAF
jgi:hypothetical protein